MGFFGNLKKARKERRFAVMESAQAKFCESVFKMGVVENALNVGDQVQDPFHPTLNNTPSCQLLLSNTTTTTTTSFNHTLLLLCGLLSYLSHPPNRSFSLDFHRPATENFWPSEKGKKCP